MWMSSEQDPLCTSANEEFGPLANNLPPTGYEPNFFDDFHYSETTENFLQEQSSDTMPSYLHDFRQSEKIQRTEDKLITLTKKVCCPLSPFSHTLVPGDPYANLVRAKNENPSRDPGNERFKIRDASLDRQPKIQSSSVEETLQRITGQTNNDCRFRIFISTILYTSHVCLLEDKILD